jgi:Predicted extracellular nuclease
MRRHALPLATLALALAGCEGRFPVTDLATVTAPAHAGGTVPIGAVQGRGAASPLAGETVVVEGVVTGNFRQHLGGWFLQDDGDGDDATSDAIFVLGGGDAGIRSGDRVRVRGRVTETGDGDATLTALEAIGIEVLGRGEPPAPLVLDAPPADWERLEGMRVRISAPLTISGVHDLARRGVLVASFGGRLPTPTEVARPGDAARRVAEDNARRRLLVDDARASENPRGIWYLDGRPAPRAGSTITLAEGILDQRWGEYRLQLTVPLQFDPAPRPEPPRVGGDVRLASFNLENLFNGDGRGGGFPTPRGARTPEELQAQLDRLVATIRGLDPDIAALMELENDGFDPGSSIAQLTDALNAGGGDWRFVDAGRGPGSDVIRVGLLYRASRVRPVGRPATLEEGPFGPRSRAPLAQAFRRGDGPAFVVVANHFKSKGCNEAAGANRDQGDGQGCWNALRVDSAKRLMRWLQGDPTGTGSDLVAIVGDFNAYAMEDPIRAFRDAGWRDAFEGASGEIHSYVYDGQAGRLDHALLSPALARRLAGAAKWHSNADEPRIRGERDGNGADSGASPWRSSDHDPLLVGFRLGSP